MHLTGIFFLLFLSAGIGTTEGIDIWGWIKSLFEDPLAAIKKSVCSYAVKNPTRVTTAISKISDGLRQSNRTAQAFANTLAYITNTTNQANFIGSTSTCPKFIDGWKNALQLDLQNPTYFNADSQGQAVNIINDILSGFNAQSVTLFSFFQRMKQN